MMSNVEFKWSGFVSESLVNVLGSDAYSFIETLYPICRSITGAGSRQTLQLIAQQIGLEVSEIPTGTQVFDWVVPEEWNIRDAYIEDMSGNKLIDFKVSNLHVVSYSMPIDKVVSKEELDEHLHSIPEHPEWVPYRTSYYNKSWGFCLSDNQRQSLVDAQYKVYIDSDFKQGSLSYGECYIEGESKEEFLLFAHICHPSLCNDNLSGISIATQLVKYLSSQKLNKSYRIVFAPATIGSISWLSQNQDKLSNIKAGLVIAVAGDSGSLTYKRSRNEGSYIDRMVFNALKTSGKEFNVLDFSPYGYDERQFASPGINLPVGSLMRTPNGCYPEYHTSADNLDLVQPEYLSDTIESYIEVLNIFDNNASFVNLQPYGEPQLGKRGLYRKTGGLQDIEESILAKLWVLNLSDGDNDLLAISIKSKMTFKTIQCAAEELFQAGLLEYVEE